MDKLPPEQRFFDFSDYSRSISRLLVRLVINTKLTPVFFTTISLVCGILSAALIYFDKFSLLSAILILLKSFFDAVDGELARARNRPSYVGRFYDSVVDFFVNVIIFLSLAIRFQESFIKFFVVIILFHLQGSVYNYYYVLKRHKTGGDKTSRIDERKIEQIYPYDNPFWFKVFHSLYVWIYSWQDWIIYKFDSSAEKLSNIPNSFMTIVSLLGLGTQLLIIAFFVLTGLERLIIDFFIYFYTLIAIAVILIRKIFYREN
jgi:phosphatidylglycerophosphate synthase